SRERQGGDPSEAIRRKRRTVEVGRCARDGACGRPAISRSRPSACHADRWQGICGQARPVACAQDCKQRRRKRRKIDGQHAAACARTQENQARDPDSSEGGGDRRAFQLTIFGRADEAGGFAPCVLIHIGSSICGRVQAGRVRSGEAQKLTKVVMNPEIIQHYQPHVFYDPVSRRDRAARLRDHVAAAFPGVTLGRWHDTPVGPHTRAMYQLAFPPSLLASFLPWLMLNREGLSILLHPGTGDAYADHIDHAVWLGSALPLRADVLPKPWNAPAAA